MSKSCLRPFFSSNLTSVMKAWSTLSVEASHVWISEIMLSLRLIMEICLKVIVTGMDHLVVGTDTVGSSGVLNDSFEEGMTTVVYKDEVSFDIAMVEDCGTAAWVEDRGTAAWVEDCGTAAWVEDCGTAAWIEDCGTAA